MTDIDVFRLSAEACGYETVGNEYGYLIVLKSIDGGPLKRAYWNPIFSAQDRWDCVMKLLDMGYSIRFHADDDINSLFHAEEVIDHQCPAEEFPARALAELQSRKG
jgi:hypothetical protein